MPILQTARKPVLPPAPDAYYQYLAYITNKVCFVILLSCYILGALLIVQTKTGGGANIFIDFNGQAVSGVQSMAETSQLPRW